MNIITSNEQLFSFFYHKHKPLVYHIREERDWDIKDWYSPINYIRRNEAYDYWLSETDFIGFRFGTTTNYAIIDIDKKSDYLTPQQVSLVVDLLYDQLGIEGVILLQSSYPSESDDDDDNDDDDSPGIHLLIPFAVPVNSWSLMMSISHALLTNELKINDGLLELFPNFKAYESSYKAVRTPGQLGQFILDSDLNPILECTPTNLIPFINQAMEVNVDFTLPELSPKELKDVKNYYYSTLPAIADNDRLLTQFKTNGWIEGRSTNSVLPVIVRNLVRKGYTDPDQIEDEAREIFYEHATYERYSSDSDKRIRKNQGWLYQWAKYYLNKRRDRTGKDITAVLKPKKDMVGTQKRTSNQKALEEAMSRLRKKDYPNYQSLALALSRLTGIKPSTLRNRHHKATVRGLAIRYGIEFEET